MSETQSSVLAEELIAMEAIYGEDFQITSSSSNTTAISIKLDSHPFAFLLSIPSTYPSRPPEIRGTDPLWLRDSTLAEKGINSFKEWLSWRFVPGELHLFSLIEDVRECLRAEATSRVQNRSRATLPPLETEDEMPCPKLVNVTAMQKSAMCNACLDTFFRVDLAKLQCKHLYCPECVQRGFEISITVNLPFKCCQRRLKFSVISQFVILPRGQLKKYAQTLLEIDTLNQLYCDHPRCAFFLGSASNFASQRVCCPQCTKWTCKSCLGIHCAERLCDELFVDMVKGYGWKRCPKCNMIVERISGCRQMHCRCGQDFCYDCGERRTNVGYGCACGLG